jgi:hypothetical protein
MVMSRIATPVFNGAPTDDLAAVDVYGEVAPDVKNKFVSTYSAFSNELSQQLGQSRDSLGDLFSAVKNREIGLKTASDRLKGILTGARADFTSFTGSFKDRLAESLAPSGGDYDYVQAKVDDIYRTIRTGDTSSATGVMSMLKDLTGNSLFSAFDVGAEIGLISVALEEISKWEIPELIDEALDYFDDEDSKRAAVRRSSSRLMNVGDIDSIERMINQVGASALTADNPDFAINLVRRYQFKVGETVNDYPARLAQLVRVLDALDPTWLMTIRNGESVYQLKTLQLASADAKTLLSTSPTYRVPALIAPHYPLRDVTQLMRSMYPMIAIAR